MSTTNDKILTCIDSSIYMDSVVAHAAWVSTRLSAPVQLLHIQTPIADGDPSSNLSGAIGLGVKSSLLEKLTQLDEARGKLEQQKGKLIIDHAKEMLAAEQITKAEALHRRGSLVESIAELEHAAQMIVLGKRGEEADFATLHLGSNLERVVRVAKKPVLVASRTFKPISRFVIAYDGGPSTLKAIDYVINNPLFQGLECHLLKVGTDNDANQRDLQKATTKLQESGFSVNALLRQGDADAVIANYVKTAEIDLLLMGAYGHSRIRTLIIGSTTSSMLRSCLIPVLMFR